MSHIFISYSRQDSGLLSQIRSDLEKNGFGVWTDENLKPGTSDWQRSIETAIELADAVVVILSPTARDSEYVRKELSYAKMHEIRIFPILAKGTPSNAVPLILSTEQWVDIRQPEKCLPEIQKLVNAMKAHCKTIPRKNIEKREARRWEEILTIAEMAWQYARFCVADHGVFLQKPNQREFFRSKLSAAPGGAVELSSSVIETLKRDLILHDLAQIINFKAEDLEANRAGTLSHAQHNQFDKHQEEARRIAIISMLISIMSIPIFLSATHENIVCGVIAFFAVPLAIHMFRVSSSFSRRIIMTEIGWIEHDEKNNTLKIGKRQFSVFQDLPKTKLTIPVGRFCVYYVPVKSVRVDGVIVSAEPVEEA